MEVQDRKQNAQPVSVPSKQLTQPEQSRNNHDQLYNYDTGLRFEYVPFCVHSIIQEVLNVLVQRCVGWQDVLSQSCSYFEGQLHRVLNMVEETLQISHQNPDFGNIVSKKDQQPPSSYQITQEHQKPIARQLPATFYIEPPNSNTFHQRTVSFNNSRKLNKRQPTQYSKSKLEASGSLISLGVEAEPQSPTTSKLRQNLVVVPTTFDAYEARKIDIYRKIRQNSKMMRTANFTFGYSSEKIPLLLNKFHKGTSSNCTLMEIKQNKKATVAHRNPYTDQNISNKQGKRSLINTEQLIKPKKQIEDGYQSSALKLILDKIMQSKNTVSSQNDRKTTKKKS